ncbi:MAG TPA: hypothetical protein VLX68_15035 [Chitinivibrionales bacterium]|nr:hypothetical protein [Chitinivibrionales bacterium]
MRNQCLSFCLGCIILLSFVSYAENIKKDTTVNGLKIELLVLPAEPFFTKQQVNAKKVSSGMLIIEGSKPFNLENPTKPNHHLVIHVYDAKSGKALTTAKVKMSFQQIDETGKLLGKSTEIPIIKMESIGRGQESTHYGNNVTMPDGTYRVQVLVNGNSLMFDIGAKTGPKSSMENMEM